jgi:hypothetical protein
MTMQSTPLDDIISDLDSESSSLTAELDPSEPAESNVQEWTGPQCEKCGTPLKSGVVTVCRHCGWYASLGQFVEIDQDWEVDFEGEQQPVERPRPSHIEVWLNLLPWWAWVLIGTASVVVVESVAVRLLTPAGSSLRTTWSLTQLGLGLLAFAVCHVFNFVVAVVDDAEVGALDLVLKPLKLWLRAFKILPVRWWVTATALGGLTGVVMSLVVIGSLPYDRLWDWGFEKRPEQNLMGAVMSRMQQIEGEGADNLEEAVGDFAGSQNLDPDAGRPAPPPKPRENVDCVILGYRLDAVGRLNSVVLATAYRRKLVYAGYVTPKLSDEEREELTNRLIAAKTDRPFLTIQTTAVWVEPILSCRVSYTKRSDTGRILDPQWEELLGQIKLEN